ncbi:Z-ring formation inhibitor MciZ [Peribacillus glennii]|uniref:Z-ring formation inhibitor MciZ n=1 Tax=Peribacillus glennii TaxID=2303991 RepID=A0A372LHZ9_9BACI|nr:Z-ring formation inhibitor MciZ [Peribacillus glennii]RFU65614.1 Z-ring formation inhibitor MciZ [Peribacillus glennii]
MKVYVLNNGIVMAGKAWEIKQKLKQFQDRYTYVNDWVRDVHGPASVPSLRRIK